MDRTSCSSYLLCVLNPKTNVYMITGVSCKEEGEAEVKYAL